MRASLWWTAVGAALFAGSMAVVLREGSSATAVVLASFSLVAFGVAAWEHGPNGAREVALVASYAATAAAGRVLFVAIPSVQPVTVMTACAGAALGPRAGAAVGALAALVSNGFLGQGPWTPWQMLAWGLVGASAGLCGPLLRRRSALVVFGVAWGFAYGALTNLSLLASFGPAWTWAAFRVVEVRGLPFDTAHALGNAVIAAVAGPALVRLLERYGRRLEVEIVWDAEDEPEPATAAGGGAAA